MSIFASFGLKMHLPCYKGGEEIFYKLLVSFVFFPKSILDDAIVGLIIF